MISNFGFLSEICYGWREASKDQFQDVMNQIAKIAKKNGIQPYLAGGAVRDEVAGIPWNPLTDGDMTGAEKDDGLQLAYLIARDKNLPNPDIRPDSALGIAHMWLGGVELEFNGAKAIQHEVHKWLEEKGLDITHWNTDVYARDFTINALYKDLFTGEIIDPTGKGIVDTKKGTIRAVRDADNLIKQEPRRVLRAIRFKLQLNGEYEPNLAKAMKKYGRLMKKEGHTFEKYMKKLRTIKGYEAELKKFGLGDLI